MQAVGAPYGLDKQVKQVAQPRPRNVTLTDEERARLMAASGPALRCFILLCSDLALRSGTAIRVAPKHYDPIKGEVRISTKGSTAVHLPTTDALDDLFMLALSMDTGRHSQTTPFISLLSGRTMTRSAIGKQFRNTCKRLNIVGKTPHDLRRTTAVKVMDITKDLRVVQHLLGHRNLNATLHYLDHDNNRIDRETIHAASMNSERIKP